jgi:hypothetical protein
MYSFQLLNGRKFRTTCSKDDALTCHIHFFAIDELTGNIEDVNSSEVDFSTFIIFKPQRQKIRFLEVF